MKHILLTIVALALVWASVTAQTTDTAYVHVPTMTDLFARAPRTVFPLLDRNTRLDMIDYYNSGLQTPSRNMLGGDSRITSVADMSLDIDMSPASSYHMCLLKARNDTIIALVRTVLLPTPDSDMGLYTTTWEPVTVSGDKEPTLDQWLIKGIKGSDPDVVNLVPFVTSTITVTGDTVTFRRSLAHRYVSDDSIKVAAAMHPYIRYRWNGDKRQFKPIK